MKVCLICNQIAAWNKVGGFGTNTRRLGSALTQQGVEVHVVVPRRGEQKKIEQLDGMTVHGLSKFEVFFDKTVYRKIDADIYHSEEPQVCSYTAQKAMPDRIHIVTCRDPRVRQDWWIHFRYATWRRRVRFPTQFIYENSPLTHRAVRRADGQYVEFEFLRNKAKKVYKLKQRPGLLPKPLPVPDGPFMKSQTPLCVFLGRYDPIKRPELYFELAKQLPKIQFVAIGTVEHPRYFETLSKKYAHLPNLTIYRDLDPFTSNQISEILSNAWILVHTAVKEAFPTVFAEAGVHEAAIVAYLDPDQYVSRFGTVVPESGGIRALKKSVEEMIESSSWKEKGQAARTYNIEHHSLARCVERHLEVYQSHLSKSTA